MEKIGIFGGTFNPPHVGHIQAAVNGVNALNLDRMLMIPGHIAPHKQLPENSASSDQRLEMLRIAAEGLDKIEVSDIEIRREGISYTWQTMEELKNLYPNSKLYLFMGTDMFLSFEQWKEVDRITKCAAIAVFYRGEKGEKKAILSMKEKLEKQGVEVELVENPVVNISSTDLRRMIAFQFGDQYFPAGIKEFIQTKQLYDSARSFRNLPMAQLEPIVVRLLNPNRVKHVLGCRDTAVELARKWGADETDASRAGILHDITKALTGDQQLLLCKDYGVELDAFSQAYPKTLHALTGSLVADRIFGENKAVVDAICSHTTGKANMNLLEKIIYVADYMEPNRDFPGVERLRELAFSDIDAALRLGLEMTLDHLEEQGSELSPVSAEALEYLKSHGKG